MKTIKAYLVTYTKASTPLVETKTVVVFAYDKQEAGDLFVKWAKAMGHYESITNTVVQVARRTKRNKRFFSVKTYNEQCKAIEDLYIAYMKKAGN